MVKSVEQYLLDGCMRCDLGATPKCKVNTWRVELETLRQVVLETELKEEVKWGVPCYTYEGKNIAMVSAFKEHACLSFFKGALLKDSKKVLKKPGESSQSSRVMTFTKSDQIIAQAKTIKAYLAEAIILEKEGKKVEFKKDLEPIPDELIQLFAKDAAFKKAFYALTPGRQRGYIIYFSQPKQAQTRISRIEKCKQMILEGIGLNDKYKPTK
jgi:uncharacterized protein YdeI (YjbR/CyaY-like superfamily)